MALGKGKKLINGSPSLIISCRNFRQAPFQDECEEVGTPERTAGPTGGGAGERRSDPPLALLAGAGAVILALAYFLGNAALS
jgi:hypothetical protein